MIEVTLDNVDDFIRPGDGAFDDYVFSVKDKYGDRFVVVIDVDDGNFMAYPLDNANVEYGRHYDNIGHFIRWLLSHQMTVFAVPFKIRSLM